MSPSTRAYIVRSLQRRQRMNNLFAAIPRAARQGSSDSGESQHTHLSTAYTGTAICRQHTAILSVQIWSITNWISEEVVEGNAILPSMQPKLRVKEALIRRRLLHVHALARNFQLGGQKGVSANKGVAAERLGLFVLIIFPSLRLPFQADRCCHTGHQATTFL